MPTLKITCAASLMLAGLAAVAQAQAPPITVENAWSRATPSGASTGAVYLTLTSATGDTLTGVSSPASTTAEVHEMTMDGDVMRMRELPAGLDLPAGQPVTLKPNGYHIMLVGLKAPLKQGQTVSVHLTFAKSAPLDLTAKIAGIGATNPPGSPAGGTTPGTKIPQ